MRACERESVEVSDICAGATNLFLPIDLASALNPKQRVGTLDLLHKALARRIGAHDAAQKRPRLRLSSLSITKVSIEHLISGRLIQTHGDAPAQISIHHGRARGLAEDPRDGLERPVAPVPGVRRVRELLLDE